MNNIQDYEGLYAITEDGQIWGYKRKRFLKPGSDKDGYLQVSLSKNGKTKTFKVHRLVAQAFIPNPNNLPQVNHKDENKQNNCVDNLEWCDAKYNNGQKSDNNRRRKAVLCVELNKIYNSLKEASQDLNIDSGNISKCCSNPNRTAGKYHWRYAGIEAASF